MGKVASAIEETNNKKRKKKGRPSLLDLQKRSLRLLQKHHHQNPNLKNPNSLPLNPNPNPSSNNHPARRSTRRNPDPDCVYDQDDDEDERKEKKLKLVDKLPPLNLDRHRQRPRSSPNSNAPNDRSDYGSADKGEKVKKATDTPHGSGTKLETGPTTPLPDKKLLVFILDRLQKKDTYSVFSDPVDPNELPDYHEIIDHPMDFGTVRKKLDGGLYSYLEQFEADVFLICENAMQYNSADTIYFRQARTIQELAKKDFENLRQDSDDSDSLPKVARRGDESDSQPKVARRGRPPKNLKNPIGGSPSECAGPGCYSAATLASAEDNTLCGNSYNLRKVPTLGKFRPADAPGKASNRSRSIELGFTEGKTDFAGSVMKGVSMKHTNKQCTLDDSRRNTYKQYFPSGSGYESPVFTALDGGLKQLMVVGLHTEHAYARSLARFAANLGPVAWEIASKKLQSALPDGTKFGPGWVEEKELPPRPSTFYERPKSATNSMYNYHPRSSLPPSTSSSFVPASTPPFHGKENMEEGLYSQSKFSSSDNATGGIKTVIQPDMNGFCGGFGFSLSQKVEMVKAVASTSKCSSEGASILPQALGMAADTTPVTSSCAKYLDSDDAKRVHYEHLSSPEFGPKPHGLPAIGLCGKPSRQKLSHHQKQGFLPIPPDLNVRFQAPGTPNSTVQINSPQQQPDLVLQL